MQSLKVWLMLAQLGLVPLAAHTTPPSYDVYPAERIIQAQVAFPDAPAVYLLRSETVRLVQAPKAPLSMTTEVEQWLYVRRVDGQVPRELDVVISPTFEQLGTVEVSTMAPDPRNPKRMVTVKQDLRRFQPRQLMPDYIFFDDTQLLTVPFPNVEPGAVVRVRYTKRYLYPQVIDPFHFSSDAPVLEARLAVETQGGVSLRAHVLGSDTAAIARSVGALPSGGERHEWTMRQVKLYLRESNAVNTRHYRPHVVVYPTGVAGETQTRAFLKGVKELYDWSYELADRRDKTVSPALKELVRELTREQKTEADKARALFQWTQQNVKYIAFEDGWHGFVPAGASKVHEARYGDCKGMANLLHTMLTEAGLRSYLCWIGTRDLPYRYAELPTPGASNHMIAAVELDSKLVFLDATDYYVPFGLPTSMIQGKEALVGRSASTYEVRRIEPVSAELNRLTETLDCHLEGTVLSGQGRTLMGGYAANRFRHGYFAQSSPAERQKLAHNFTQKGNAKWKSEIQAIGGTEDRLAPIALDYKFTLPDYVRAAAGRVFVNLHLSRPFNESVIDLKHATQTQSIEYQRSIVDTVRFTVPPGHAVSPLPADETHADPLWQFSIRYRQVDDRIELIRTVTVEALEIPASQFESWNAFVRHLQAAYRQAVVLTPKS